MSKTYCSSCSRSYPSLMLNVIKCLTTNQTPIVNVHTVATSPPQSSDSSYIQAAVLLPVLHTQISVCGPKESGPTEACYVFLLRMSSLLLHFCKFMSAAFEFIYFVITNIFVGPTKFFFFVFKFLDNSPLLRIGEFYVLRTLHFRIFSIEKQNTVH